MKLTRKPIHFLYTKVTKPILFLSDPENVHDSMTNMGKFLGKYSFTRILTGLFFNYENKMLNQEILGIKFPNPIGLSAGFDKNAELLEILPSVGFGFIEIGSITGYACNGNPKPRLWRMPKSKSLLVYYGLKNNGCEEISNRIKNKKINIPFGTSVAMTNCQENLDISKAVEDFAKAFEAFINIGDYTTVNISCPNTQGGQPFSEKENLDILFTRLDKIKTEKPIFIKLSPDKSKSEIDGILEVLKKHRVHGIICSNLTKKRDNPLIKDTDVPTVGGISGKVIQDMSDDLISYIYKKEGHRFILVGVGGVFSAEDAYKKIRSGATLIQLITGMIFEGPQLIGQINSDLVKLLKKDGFKNISEAVGVDIKNKI